MMDEFWTHLFNCEITLELTKGPRHGWLHSWQLHNRIMVKSASEAYLWPTIHGYLHVRAAAYPYIVVLFQFPCPR